MTIHKKPSLDKEKTTHKELPEEQLEVEESISAELAEVIKDLPEEKGKLVIQALMVNRHYSGPLPDGENIKIYNEVIPNGGDRLMKTVEKQLEHRIEIEKTGIRRSFNQSSTGQWMGYCIAIVFGIIAWDLGKSGKEIVASILGSIDLVALVAIFITGRKSRD